MVAVLNLLAFAISHIDGRKIHKYIALPYPTTGIIGVIILNILWYLQCDQTWKLKQFNIANWTGNATLLGAACNLHAQIGFIVQTITAEPHFYITRNGCYNKLLPKFAIYR